MRCLSLSVAFFIFAICGFNAGAERLGGARLGPARGVACSLPPRGPDSSTSAIQHDERFVAREHFKEDIRPGAPVRISWLGATFVRRFASKVEAARDTLLQTFVLQSPSNDREIITELGDGHETTLADVWCLLRLQASGEPGALQTNSTPNIFFVRDGAGQLGVVDAIWGGAGWEIGASPFGDKRAWSVGTRVISR
jgi:hypothetical protein